MCRSNRPSIFASSVSVAAELNSEWTITSVFPICISVRITFLLFEEEQPMLLIQCGIEGDNRSLCLPADRKIEYVDILCQKYKKPRPGVKPNRGSEKLEYVRH
jgi:hypothetical protein